MKAIVISKCGGPENMELKENVDIPLPKEGELQVKMLCSSVNMIDVYFRNGLYKSNLPFIGGCDGVGIIEKRNGEHIPDHFKIGSKVAFNCRGTHAEFICVPHEKCFVVDDDIPDEIACSLVVNGLTAHYLTRSTYQVKKDDLVLVHAVSGGTGQLILQICKILGAKVIGTCSTEEKMKLAYSYGCDYVINYREDDFVSKVKEYCSEHGYEGCNVAYDGVGKKTYEGSMKCLKSRGFCVLFGNASGKVPPIDPLMLTQLGSIFLTRPSLFNHFNTEEERQWRTKELFEWIKKGTLKPKIHKQFDPKDIAKAHQEIEGRKTLGKIIIKGF